MSAPARPHRLRALVGISYGLWSRSLAAVVCAPSVAGPPERLLVRAGDQIKPVLVREIVLITGTDDYSEVRTGNEAHLVRMSLAAFEAQLDERRFVRIHHSAIVNLDHLESAEPAGSGRLLLKLSDGASVATSRAEPRRLAGRVGRQWFRVAAGEPTTFGSCLFDGPSPALRGSAAGAIPYRKASGSRNILYAELDLASMRPPPGLLHRTKID